MDATIGGVGSGRGGSASMRGGELLCGGGTAGEDVVRRCAWALASSGGSESCIRNLGLPNSPLRAGDVGSDVLSRCCRVSGSLFRWLASWRRAGFLTNMGWSVRPSGKKEDQS